MKDGLLAQPYVPTLPGTPETIVRQGLAVRPGRLGTLISIENCFTHPETRYTNTASARQMWHVREMRKSSELEITVCPLSVLYSVSTANHYFYYPLGLLDLINKMTLEEDESTDLASGKANYFSCELPD